MKARTEGIKMGPGVGVLGELSLHVLNTPTLTRSREDQDHLAQKQNLTECWMWDPVLVWNSKSETSLEVKECWASQTELCPILF